MTLAGQLHAAGNKVHRVERVAHAISHPVQHGQNGVKWRIRRLIHRAVDKMLRVCCCGMLN